MIQLQSEPRSRIKLFKTFSVYIIVLCLKNASNDTVAGLNWIPGTDKMDTYDTGKVSGFRMSFVPGTRFYRQKTKYTKPAAKPVPTTSVQAKTYVFYVEFQGLSDAIIAYWNVKIR